MSAFVVSNVHEKERVAPHKSTRPIDVPTSARPASRSRSIIKEPSSQPDFDENAWRSEDLDDGLDDDLQFLVDDVVSPASATSPSTRAYKRAVCVSFAAVDQEKAVPLSHLEAKVQHLVHKVDAWQSDAAVSDRKQLAALAAYLRKHGLQAEVTAPPKPSALAPLSTRSINEPFLLVTAATGATTEEENSDDDLAFTDATKRPAVGARSRSQLPQVVIVDAALRQHLALAPVTEVYERALEASVPAVFVGTRSRLTRLVSLLSPAISANFTAHGMEQPPWRRRSALLHRWSAVEEQERLLRLRWEDLRRGAAAGAAAGDATNEGHALSKEQQSVVGVEGEVAWPAGMPPAERLSVAMAAVVPVLGFDVGSAAVGSAPWADTTPEVFVGSLFRRQSQADSDGSSADTEEVILGLSPVSVFRDAPVVEAAAMQAKVALVGF